MLYVLADKIVNMIEIKLFAELKSKHTLQLTHLIMFNCSLNITLIKYNEKFLKQIN